MFNFLQVLCALSQGATFLFTTWSTFAALVNMLNSNDFSRKAGAAITIFDVGSSAALVVTSVFLIYSSWKRKHLILEIVERTRATSSKHKSLRIIGAMVSLHKFEVLKFVFKCHEQ